MTFEDLLSAKLSAVFRCPFPSQCRGAVVRDIDLVMLDADTFGMADTYRTSHGHINEFFQRYKDYPAKDGSDTEPAEYLVEQLNSELLTVVGELDGEAKEYFEQYLEITKLILQDIHRRRRL